MIRVRRPVGVDCFVAGLVSVGEIIGLPEYLRSAKLLGRRKFDVAADGGSRGKLGRD
jgi:hypothetical protein